MTAVLQELPAAADLHAAAAAAGDAAFLVLAENTAVADERARWAFLAADPAYVFRAERDRAWGGPPGRERRLDDSPLDALAALLARRHVTAVAGAPPWCSGAAGYFGYGLLHEIEDVADSHHDQERLPDCRLGFFDAVAATDLVAGRSWVCGRDVATTETMTRRVEDAPAPTPVPAPAPPARRVNLDDLLRADVAPTVERDGYLAAIGEIKEHLLAGDCYEVCLTQRFDTTFPGDGAALYAALRRASPAPHAAYVRFPDVELLCASPERFLRCDARGSVETRPIKGTRPRGSSAAEDATLAADLAASPKDAAENLMIVDLSRNDLGRVCEYGSVRVPQLRVVETHAQTHQLVSTITGRLRSGVGPVDLLRAAFPGGSMTGAPKVAAMSIIDGLETVPRGPYAGAIGWIDDTAALDLNIVIRTFVKTGEQVTFHTGGAIVADSDPAAEYQESLDKTAGLLAALALARS